MKLTTDPGFMQGEKFCMSQVTFRQEEFALSVVRTGRRDISQGKSITDVWKINLVIDLIPLIGISIINLSVSMANPKSTVAGGHIHGSNMLGLSRSIYHKDWGTSCEVPRKYGQLEAEICQM